MISKQTIETSVAALERVLANLDDKPSAVKVSVDDAGFWLSADELRPFLISQIAAYGELAKVARS